MKDGINLQFEKVMTLRNMSDKALLIENEKVLEKILQR